MVKVYGYSDYLVEIEVDGNTSQEIELDKLRRYVRIRFTDGTVILVGYPKVDADIWWIYVEKMGSATQKMYVCNDEESSGCSDIFEIDAEVDSCSVLRDWRKK